MADEQAAAPTENRDRPRSSSNANTNSGLAYGNPTSRQNTASSDRKQRPSFMDALASLRTPTSKISPPDFGQKDILIAVMGITGAGKTSFIRDVTGVDMEVGHNLRSCTQHIQIATTRINGHVVRLIDTPGFDDTDVKDSDILMTIANYLRDSAANEIRLSGILYLHRIIDPRVGGSALKNLGMFRKLVGNENMKNVILLTTMWSKVDPKEGEQRLKELVGSGKFWGGMITSGASSKCYGDDPAEAHRIVRSMLQNSRIVLQIQAELENGTNLENTAAGREVNARLAKLKEEHERQLQAVREEMLEASNTRNESLIQELQALNDRLMKEQAEAAEARERLHQAEIEQMRERIDQLEGRSTCIVC